MYTRDDPNIILFVYDISCKESFIHLPAWIKDLTNINMSEVIFALVGNKNDLSDKREVNEEEAKKYAEEHDFIFQEAKTGDGFSDLFYKNLFEKIRTKFRPGGNNLLQKLMILNLILKKILKELRKKVDVLKININKKRN